MLAEETRLLIVDTSEVLELDPSVIEKDYYVTQILNVLANIKNEHSDLIFAGGTCLAKAHRIVKRMSEDIDFKFQKKTNYTELSKNQYLKTIKVFRDEIVSILEKTEFNIKEAVVRNEGKYLRIHLEYPPAFDPTFTLRSHLLLEFTASEIRLPTQELPITTLIQDTLGQNAGLEFNSLMCVSIEETAAEKWVGLTRRIAASDRGYYPEDITLVRHIYDLSAIVTANKLGDAFFNITKEIVDNDAKQFKTQHPEYLSDPIKEIQRTLSVLKTDAGWQARYQDFVDTMVYDKITPHSYANAVAMLEKVSSEVMGSLKQFMAEI